MTQPGVMAASGRTPKTVWIGRVLSALPVGMMLFSAAMKLHPSPQVVQFTKDHFGYPESAFKVLLVLELTSVILYAIPQTAVFGAIVMTGYLGGAIASHFRVGDPPFAQALLIVIAWAGLYLREDRLRALLPLRTLTGARHP